MEVRSKNAPHGQKRRAEEELVNDQRLIKRFDLLNLERNGKLYIPVDQTSSAPSSRATNDDSMQVDDTRDRVYIHNLDEELKAVDEAENRAIFLPDIERKLSKIPKSVLTSHSQPLTKNEMVLYSVPSSLTVPREQDSVRKAIAESRARARQKQADDAEAARSIEGTISITNNGSTREEHMEEDMAHGRNTSDEDAMDLG